MSTINVTRGSDVSITMTWRDSDQLPIDLSDMTLSLLDVAVGIVDKLSGVISDAVNGKVTISLEGTDPIKTGTYKFRVKLTSSLDNSIASPLIKIKIE